MIIVAIFASFVLGVMAAETPPSPRIKADGHPCNTPAVSPRQRISAISPECREE